MTIERGDTVIHHPSAEEWIVRKVEDGYVYPCGWPPSRALLADCELQYKADPSVIEWLDREDARLSPAQRQAAERGESR